MFVLFCISSFEVTSYKGYMIVWLQVGFKERVRSQGKQLKSLSEGRKAFRITVHFSSDKMKSRSALQIVLREMQLQLTLKLYFKVSVADCSPKILGLHLAMLTLMPTIKIQRWQFFADIVYLSPLSINLPNLNFFAIK